VTLSTVVANGELTMAEPYALRLASQWKQATSISLLIGVFNRLNGVPRLELQPGTSRVFSGSAQCPPYIVVGRSTVESYRLMAVLTWDLSASPNNRRFSIELRQAF